VIEEGGLISPQMSGQENGMIEIKRIQNQAQAELCARMMANTEPWITLRRDYAASLKILTDPSRNEALEKTVTYRSSTPGKDRRCNLYYET